MAVLALHQALEQGNIAEVRKLLDQKVDVNEKDSRGWTPLHAAVFNCSKIDEIKFLLNAGANASINVQDYFGITPLHIAAQVNRTNEDVLQLLFDTGADKSISIKDNYGATPLHLAACNWNNSNTFKLLLQHAESKSVVNEIDKYGETPLSLAAYKGKTDFMKLLLQHGAEPSVNFKIKDGNTLLLVVITRRKEYKHEDLKAIVKILVETGADVNVRSTKTGYTALHLAALGNDTDLVEFLLSIGAELNAKDNKGFTPLSLALDCNKDQSHLSVIQTLITKSFVTGADLHRLEDKINRERELESTKLGELRKKFEEYSANAETKMSQLSEELSRERQDRRVEVEKLEEKLSNQEREMESVKVEELRKKFEEYSENTETRISQLMEMRKNDEGKISGSRVISIIFKLIHQWVLLKSIV